MGGAILYSVHQFKCRHDDQTALCTLVDALMKGDGMKSDVAIKTTFKALRHIKPSDAFEIVRQRCVDKTDTLCDFNAEWNMFSPAWYNNEKVRKQKCVQIATSTVTLSSMKWLIYHINILIILRGAGAMSPWMKTRLAEFQCVGIML